MKSVIIYASTHHGNTFKVVDAISKECSVELIDATKVHEADLSDYDLIGFASGIFYSKFSAQVLKFIELLPENKNVFFIATAGNPMERYFDGVSEMASNKKCKVVGKYQCKGFDTYGPFKLVGGIQKGHPTEEEISKAVEFYRGLCD